MGNLKLLYGISTARGATAFFCHRNPRLRFTFCVALHQAAGAVSFSTRSSVDVLWSCFVDTTFTTNTTIRTWNSIDDRNSFLSPSPARLVIRWLIDAVCLLDACLGFYSTTSVIFKGVDLARRTEEKITISLGGVYRRSWSSVVYEDETVWRFARGALHRWWL